MLERLLIYLVCLCVLYQIFLNRIVLIFVAVVVTAKESIERQSIIRIAIVDCVTMHSCITLTVVICSHRLLGTLALSHLVLNLAASSEWLLYRVCLVPHKNVYLWAQCSVFRI